uniref:Uncharacterized protein n=1 Tax=Molossus molossus TaxID=27622 RepID=A0A7J8JWD7_MOLMO|nr:hypothetical protein HJG59_008132 [Molossus molossus]
MSLAVDHPHCLPRPALVSWAGLCWALPECSRVVGQDLEPMCLCPSAGWHPGLLEGGWRLSSEERKMLLQQKPTETVACDYTCPEGHGLREAGGAGGAGTPRTGKVFWGRQLGPEGEVGSKIRRDLHKRIWSHVLWWWVTDLQWAKSQVSSQQLAGLQWTGQCPMCRSPLPHVWPEGDSLRTLSTSACRPPSSQVTCPQARVWGGRKRGGPQLSHAVCTSALKPGPSSCSSEHPPLGDGTDTPIYSPAGGPQEGSRARRGGAWSLPVPC